MSEIQKTRLIDVDYAKGLVICLVVLGHLSAREYPIGAEWYRVLRDLIYKFHMPLFIFFSGIVAGVSYKPLNSLKDYKYFAIYKAKRYLYSFLIFGAVILASKFFLINHFFIDNPPINLFSGFCDLILKPTKSSASYLWYIYVLYELYLFLPILMRISNNKLFYIIFVLLIVRGINLTDYFAVNYFFKNLPFFILGLSISRNYHKYTEIIDRYKLAFIFLFITSLILTTDRTLNKLDIIVSLLSIPSIHGIVRIKLINNLLSLSLLGKYSYSIYLLNTLCIGLIKAICIIIVGYANYNFSATSPILFIFGLLFPIIVKKNIFTKNRFMNSIT
jgi:fucose 4-O-acetylase-like acetyltransferase